MINKNTISKSDLKYTQRNIINIKELIDFFIRNRINLAIFTILSIIISSLVPIKSIWEGKTTLTFFDDRNYPHITGFTSDYFIKDINNP